MRQREQDSEPQSARVKGFSPEIPVVSVADTVPEGAGNTPITVKRGYACPTGFRPVASYQKERLGTWESHNVLTRKCGEYGLPSLEYGKVIQMTLWQSDKPIVAMKSLNGDGAKGLTGRPFGRGHNRQTWNWGSVVNKT